jgi:hypothetical protein
MRSLVSALAWQEAEKRQGFVGRTWLFEEVRAWATNPHGEPALLIGADDGEGTSACLAELVESCASGLHQSHSLGNCGSKLACHWRQSV